MNPFLRPIIADDELRRFKPKINFFNTNEVEEFSFQQLLPTFDEIEAKNNSFDEKQNLGENNTVKPNIQLLNGLRKMSHYPSEELERDRKRWITVLFRQFGAICSYLEASE